MKKCILCGMPLKGKPLMECNNMPFGAQDIPSNEQLGKECGIRLSLFQCDGCGLVQFDCDPVPYYRDVIRAGGYNTTMAELRRKEYRHFIDVCHLQGKKIIEVGCGQGEFLQVLMEFPVKSYGIEHKIELVKLAKNKGLNVKHNFAENANVVFDEGPFDAFLSFNFMEHQPNPNDMMQCIYNNLTEDGCGLITVPSFEYILENDSFYELVHDHIANYTKDSLQFLMNRNGFDVVESSRINRDTWEMIVRKRKKIDVSGLKSNFDRLSEQMQTYVSSRVAMGKRLAVWGASHQGFTALSTTGIYASFSYIIDSAPFKQNKYAPASHVPIVSPEYFEKNPVDCILVIAPGYTDEIVRIIREKFRSPAEIAVLKSAEIELL